MNRYLPTSLKSCVLFRAYDSRVSIRDFVVLSFRVHKVSYLLVFQPESPTEHKPLESGDGFVNCDYVVCRLMDKLSDRCRHIQPIFSFHYLCLRHIHVSRITDVSLLFFIEVALLMTTSKITRSICLLVKSARSASDIKPTPFSFLFHIVISFLVQSVQAQH